MYPSGSEPGSYLFDRDAPEPRTSDPTGSDRAIHPGAVSIYHDTMDDISYCQSLREVIEEMDETFRFTDPENFGGVSITFIEPGAFIVDARRLHLRAIYTIPIETDKIINAWSFYSFIIVIITRAMDAVCY
jgi:hypothetical protein